MCREETAHSLTHPVFVANPCKLSSLSVKPQVIHNINLLASWHQMHDDRHHHTQHKHFCFFSVVWTLSLWKHTCSQWRVSAGDWLIYKCCWSIDDAASSCVELAEIQMCVELSLASSMMWCYNTWHTTCCDSFRGCMVSASCLLLSASTTGLCIHPLWYYLRS